MKLSKRLKLLFNSVLIVSTIFSFSNQAMAAETIIRVASVTGPSHHHNVALRWFADEIAKENVGLKINVLDGAQLGGERDYIEGMMLGSIQMAQISTAPISTFIPEFDLFSLPYLIEDTNHFKNVVNSEIGERFNKLTQKRGFKILAWFDNGNRHVFNKVRPIVEPEDMKGLKIRVMESSIMIDTINAMNGSATPMSYSELYTALEQGVLDGGENSVGNVANDKFYEVTGHLSLTQHFRPPGVVAIGLSTWKRLTDEQREVLESKAKELQAYEIELTQQVEKEALEELKANGMKVNESNVPSFRKNMEPIYAEYIKKHGEELFKLIKDKA